MGCMDGMVSMDQRLAIALARRVDGGRLDVTALAAELGVSRQTFYVYERRFLKEGLVGLLPRSRAPVWHPNRVPEVVEEQIVGWHERLCEQGLDAGGRSVWARMVRAGQDPPCARTVHRVLKRRGLTRTEPQKRPRASYRRFVAAAPNAMWQIDGVQTELADGRVQVVIRVLDDHSRMTMASQVADTENAQGAWACLSKAIDRHGRPAAFLSDNGLAFNGSRKDRLVLVERNLRALGVAVISASARHPQTCGKAEREHQTFARWLAAQPAAESAEQLQQLCEIYEAIYNTERPHQALGEGTITPAEVYQASAKMLPAPGPLPTKPRITHAKVSSHGEVWIGGRISLQVGRGWEGAILDVVRDGNSVAVFYHRELIEARIIDPTRRYQPSGRRHDGHRLPRHVDAQSATPPQRGTVKVERPQPQPGRTTLTPTRAGTPPHTEPT